MPQEQLKLKLQKKLEKIDKYKNYTVIELCGMDDLYKPFDLIDDEDKTLKVSAFNNIIRAQRYRIKKILKFMDKIDKLTFYKEWK